MFRKKYKVRVRSNNDVTNCFYVEYAHYRFLPIWNSIYHMYPSNKNLYRIWNDFEKAEEFAKKFDTIEKVMEYDYKLSLVIGNTKTKIIYSK